MDKRAHLERAAKFYRFITPKGVFIASLRVFNGVCLYGAELGLAFFILMFFQRIQGTASHPMTWAPWINELAFAPFLGCFCLIVLGKGILEWIEISLYFYGEHYFLNVQRTRLTSWLFYARVLNQSHFYQLYMHETAQASSAWSALQMLAKTSALVLPMLLTLLYLSPTLTLPLLVILALVIFPLRYTNRRVRRIGQEYEKENQNLASRLAMTVKNLLLFRVHGMADNEKIYIDGTLGRLRKWGVHYGMVSAVSAAYVYLVGTTLIIVIGVVSKKISPEVAAYILPYLYLLNRFLSQVLALVSSIPQFRFMSASLNRISRWWAEHAHDGIRGRALYARSTAPCFGKVTSPLGWKVNSISYRFSDDTKSIFESYSMEIKAGEVVALVGESGSGKSTLLNLLLGELLPDSGGIEVKHDDKIFPIQDCRHEVLPRVGYVGAESFIIGGTLRENILYGLAREVSDAELEKAVKNSHCHFIYEQAKGLDHVLNDQGGGLSAGQKQRLCLARALLRDPKVLILDEATANLDEATETALIETLKELKGRMTMICATHRKGFLRLADRVIELKPKARLLPPLTATA